MSTLLFVSGASRGLGRAIAVAFAESSLLPGDQLLDAVLLARTKQGGLETTAEAMRVARPNNLEVHSYSVDLGNLSTLEDQLDPILERHHPLSAPRTPTKAPVAHSILINCAGTTGSIGRNPSSLRDIREAADLNFTSKAWLSSQFVRRHPPPSAEPTTTTTIVNISSMCAVKPTPTMGLYCATSAARDIFHTVLALDHNDDDDDDEARASSSRSGVRILNYAPGSADTDMQAFLREHDSLDPTVQAYCQSLVSEGGGLVQCRDTASELVRRVLGTGGFESGERVEFVNASTYKY